MARSTPEHTDHAIYHTGEETTQTRDAPQHHLRQRDHHTKHTIINHRHTIIHATIIGTIGITHDKSHMNRDERRQTLGELFQNRERLQAGASILEEQSQNTQRIRHQTTPSNHTDHIHGRQRTFIWGVHFQKIGKTSAKGDSHSNRKTPAQLPGNF